MHEVVKAYCSCIYLGVTIKKASSLNFGFENWTRYLQDTEQDCKQLAYNVRYFTLFNDIAVTYIQESMNHV